MGRPRASARPRPRAALPQRSSSSQPLPIEVCERIIDLVVRSQHKQARTTRTLCACALTCRAWVPRSLFHLVSSVGSIESGEHLTAFIRTLRQYPHFAAHVREINIQPCRGSGIPYYMNNFARLLAPVLTSLERISLTYDHPTPHTFHPTFPLSLTCFKSVTELNYFITAHQRFRAFAGVVSSLPALRKLHIGGGAFWKEESAISMVTRRKLLLRPALTHLILACDLSAASIADISSWLLSTSSINTLAALEVWGGGDLLDRGPAIQSVVRLITTCKSLQTLLLCVPSADLKHINLRSNIGLRKLSLVIDNCASNTIPSVTRIISNTSGALEEFTLRLNPLEGPYDALHSGCQMLDGIFASHSFTNLSCVTVDIPLKPHVLFPKLSRRQVQIDTVDSEDVTVLHRKTHPR